jgi:hypothetical protein
MDLALPGQHSKYWMGVTFRDLLRVLEKDEKKGFAQIITCDEFWFYFEYLYQLVWAQSRNNIPEKIKQRIDTEKCLVSVI